jgi:uncharacterized membrane protein
MTDHEHSHHDHHMDHTDRSFWTSRTFLVFLAFAAMGTALLWTEHKAHILGALLYLFLFACPLLHVFMHGGHGGHGGHGHAKDQPRRQGSSGAFDASKGERS